MPRNTDAVQIDITPPARRFIGRKGGHVMVRPSPRNGCCGGMVLLPVVDPGEPRERQSYRQVHQDGITVHIDSSFLQNAAPPGSLTIGLDGFWRWRKLWVAGLESTLVSGRVN